MSNYEEFAELCSPHYYAGRIFDPRYYLFDYQIVANEPLTIPNFTCLDPDLIGFMCDIGCPIQDCDSIRLYCERRSEKNYAFCLVCDKGDERWQTTINPAPMFYLSTLYDTLEHNYQERKNLK